MILQVHLTRVAVASWRKLFQLQFFFVATKQQGNLSPHVRDNPRFLVLCSRSMENKCPGATKKLGFQKFFVAPVFFCGGSNRDKFRELNINLKTYSDKIRLCSHRINVNRRLFSKFGPFNVFPDFSSTLLEWKPKHGMQQQKKNTFQRKNVFPSELWPKLCNDHLRYQQHLTQIPPKSYRKPFPPCKCNLRLSHTLVIPFAPYVNTLSQPSTRLDRQTI